MDPSLQLVVERHGRIITAIAKFFQEKVKIEL